jgi:8-oxo-dGTP pyrophosphatase MutT (NUDIX family)/transcriptional regulator with XRE-family HTH domain
MAPTTYSEVLARNIRAARSRADIGQESLATRMRNLGYSAWMRQTVGSTERGRRRPTAEEIFGLALALETSIPALLAPTADDDGIGLPRGSIASRSVEKLATGFNDHAIRWHGDVPVFGQGASSWFVDEHPEIVLPASPQQPIAAAIVTSSKGVLITERRDGMPPWGFVTGECEPGEQPEDAAVREVKEETGLEVRSGVVIGERDHPATGRHVIYLAARPVRGLKVFTDESELRDVKWASLAEALELMPDMFERVREYLARELGG